MTPRRRILAAAVSAVVAGMGLPLFARAQTASRSDFDNFRVDRVGGELLLESESRQLNNSSDGDSTRTTDQFLSESIRLDAAGSIYHPNLIEWLASGEFGLNQQWIDDEEGNERSDGTIEGYSLDAYVLKQKPLSLHLFSNYEHNFTNRDFASTLEFENARHGFDITHRGTLVSNFLAETIYDREISDFRDTTEQGERYRFTTGQRKTRPLRQEWTFEIEHEDTDEETEFDFGGTSDLPTRETELSLRHNYEFGQIGRPHVLSGSAVYLDRGGFIESDSLLLDEGLTLSHTPTLSTFYRTRYNRLTDELQEDELIDGEVGFRKEIYASLVVNASVIARERTFLEGSEDAIGGRAGLDYRKKTPWGSYFSNLDASRSYEDEESESGVRRFIDEPHVLTDANFVPLAQPNVVPGSIVVTNLDQTITYIEDIHYIVRQTGLITEIARLVGSPDPIGDGETVLVDYSAAIATDAEFTADRLTWSNRFAFDAVPIALYSSIQRREEDLTDGDDPGNLESFSSLLLGIDWTRDGLALAYEHEIVESDLGLSYDTDRVRARYDRFLNPDWQTAVGAAVERLDYTDEDELDPDEEDYLNSFSAFGQVTGRLRRNLLWRSRAEWRDTEGRQNLEHLLVTSGLEWNYRSLEMGVEARYRAYEQEESDGDLAELRITIRRFF